MDAVLCGGAEEVEAVLGERRDKEGGSLDVEDGVGAGVGVGQEGAGFFGGEAGGLEGED